MEIERKRKLAEENWSQNGTGAIVHLKETCPGCSKRSPVHRGQVYLYEDCFQRRYLSNMGMLTTSVVIAGLLEQHCELVREMHKLVSDDK